MLRCGFNGLDVDDLLTFMKKSISEREASKLFFTKIVNEIFVLLGKLGNKIGFDNTALKHLDVNMILDFYGKYEHKGIIKYFKENAKINSDNYLFNQNFDLPNVILNSEDIYFHEEKSIPYFYK